MPLLLILSEQLGDKVQDKHDCNPSEATATAGAAATAGATGAAIDVFVYLIIIPIMQGNTSSPVVSDLGLGAWR